VQRSARSPATRPCSRCARASRPSTSRAGRSRPTPTPPADVPRPVAVPRRLVPNVVKKVNQALSRADQIDHAEGKHERDWFAPIMADAEAGFGGPLNAYELMKAMIEAGAAGVHFEDQLASREEVRPHGRQGARPHVAVHPHAGRRAPRRRRDGRAHRARRPHRRRQREAPHQRPRRARPRLHRPREGRTAEGFYQLKGGVDCAIARALAYAPYADVCSGARPPPPTSTRRAVRRGRAQEVPGQAPRVQLLAELQLEEAPRRRDHREVPARARGHGVQVPVRDPGGLPHLNHAMFKLANDYKNRGMAAYSDCSSRVRRGEDGYTATRHQREVGTGYFDAVAEVISGGKASTLALHRVHREGPVLICRRCVCPQPRGRRSRWCSTQIATPSGVDERAVSTARSGAAPGRGSTRTPTAERHFVR
jgi:isocitrate lyase